MEPFWPYYAFLISWIHCFIVVWLAVSIETQSTDDVYSILDNSTTAATDTTRSLVTFVSVVMPTCPPPNNLHLLCDVTLSKHLITCKERADILELCFTNLADVYRDSKWKDCENSCDEVVHLLKNIGLLADTTSSSGKPVTVPSVFPTTDSPISSSLSSITTPSNSTTVSSNTSSSQPSGVTATPSNTSSDSAVISSTSSSATHSKATNTSGIISTIAPSIYTSVETPTSMAGEATPEEFPPLSYVYPLFGVACILIEVIVLCYIFCYRKKKQPPPVGRYRRTSTGSMVIQEEVMEAETTSPTQALCNGPGNPAVTTDESVFEEDQHIFRSYINLRYIDDTSAEGTPERVPMK